MKRIQAKTPLESRILSRGMASFQSIPIAFASFRRRNDPKAAGLASSQRLWSDFVFHFGVTMSFGQGPGPMSQATVEDSGEDGRWSLCISSACIR